MLIKIQDNKPIRRGLMDLGQASRRLEEITGGGLQRFMDADNQTLLDLSDEKWELIVQFPETANFASLICGTCVIYIFNGCRGCPHSNNDLGGKTCLYGDDGIQNIKFAHKDWLVTNGQADFEKLTNLVKRFHARMKKERAKFDKKRKK
jgi:hypothetical protein